MEPKSIGNILKSHRSNAGLTLKELAEKTGLSLSFLSDIERDRTEPSLETLRKLANAYGKVFTFEFVEAK